jgi:hypothetical protein
LLHQLFNFTVAIVQIFKKGVGSFMDLVSSRSILAAIVNGEENPETLAELSQGKLKNKMEQFPSAAHLCS